MSLTASRLLLIATVAIFGAVVALGILMLGPTGADHTERTQEPVVTGQADIGGPFSLIDHHGNPVTDRDFLGRPLLVAFGYTSCPDVCQMMLQNISEALEAMGDQATILEPLFITIDPERDTVKVLSSHLSNFHPEIRGLTGSPEAIRQVTKSYHVFYQKAEGGRPDDYLMEHSAYIYLMDGQGHYMAHFSHHIAPEALSQAILKALAP